MDQHPPEDNKDHPKHDFQFNRDFVLNNKTGIYEPESQQGKTKCSNEPHVVNILAPLPVEMKRDRLSILFAFLAIVISVATLLVIATYTYFAGGQWHEMIRAANASELAAIAASNSADMARRTLDASEQQFREEQRPYIWGVPVPTNETGFVGAGKLSLAVAVQIKNSGHSPAVDVVTTGTEFKIGPKDQVQKEVREYAPKYERISGHMLMTNEVNTVHPKNDQIPAITNTEAGNLKDGTWEAYLVGAIRYTDIFEPSIAPYETRYCFKFETRGAPFSNCAIGNASYIK
jgi:hypothetical protein